MDQRERRPDELVRPDDEVVPGPEHEKSPAPQPGERARRREVDEDDDGLPDGPAKYRVPS